MIRWTPDLSSRGSEGRPSGKEPWRFWRGGNGSTSPPHRKERQKVILTKEQKERYLESGGTKCPVCGSENLEGGDHDGAGEMTWEVRGEDCDATWVDIFHLVHVTTREEPIGEVHATTNDEPVRELAWFARLVRDFFTNDGAGHAIYLREQAVNALARAGMGEDETPESEEVVSEQTVIDLRTLLTLRERHVDNLKGHIFVLLGALKMADAALRRHAGGDIRPKHGIEAAQTAIELGEVHAILKIPFCIQDSAESSTHPDVPKQVIGQIEVGDHWISMRFDGYGTSDQEGDRGEPVYLEYYGGVLRLNVWNDINSEGHITIDLSGAKVENFKEEAP